MLSQIMPKQEIFSVCSRCDHFIDQLGHCWLDCDDLVVAQVPSGCPLEQAVVHGEMWGLPVVGRA